VGAAYSQTLAAAGGTPPYTWTVSAGALPAGLTLNAAGVLSGTPTQACASCSFTARVADSIGAAATKPFALSVTAALAITTTSPLPGGMVGAAYSQTLAATGGTPPYTWTVSAGSLAAGLTLSTAGVLSGTPTQACASCSFTVRVADSLGTAATKPFALSVTAALAITTPSPLPGGTVGAAYSQTLAAGGGTAPYTWTVSAGALPAGLTLNAAGVLSGTPTQACASCSFTVRVADSLGTAATKPSALTVTAALAITTPSPLPGGTVGAAYSQTLAAIGGTPPYTWTVSAGALPAGLTLSAEGVLSGTPTQACASCSFTVQVADSIGATSTKPFALSVTAALAIATPSPLPGGTVGTVYSQTLAAGGGTAPYTWTVSAGALPAGLTLSTAGVLSGTPTQACASCAFTVRAADSAGAAATQPLALTIVVPPAPTLSFTGLSGNVNPAAQPSFNITLAAPYSIAIFGSLTLEFTPDAVSQADDPAIQFSAGGRTLNFTIPAGQTSAFTTPPALQTGTVAGAIKLTLRLTAGGQDITPSPAPSVTAQLARSAPVVGTVQVVRTSGGFEVRVAGYSTPRQMTQANFNFTAAAQGGLQTTSLAVPLGTAFTAWYAGASSAQFGSQFLYTQPFTVQGDTGAIASVTVTLTNSVGNSQAVVSAF
jgi:hypothetical protein